MTAAMLRPFLPVLAAVVLGSTAPPAFAAQDYANCTGYIDTLPATISTAGTWCLRGNRSTSQTHGSAITIAASNVTLDCNHFRVSGPGPQTSAGHGIVVSGRTGAVIRQCRVQGFYFGMQLLGDGALAEDNAVERSGYVGILAQGDGIVIRNNAISETAGTGYWAYGVYALASADATAAPVVADNLISGVFSTSGGNATRGILTDGEARGNQISTVVGSDSVGIMLSGRGVARDNVITGGALAYIPVRGIAGTDASRSVCTGNSVVGDPAAGPPSGGYFGGCEGAGNIAPYAVSGADSAQGGR